jgi:MoxR-like ATPase
LVKSRTQLPAGEIVHIGGVALSRYDCPPEWEHLVPPYEPYEPQEQEERIVALAIKFGRPLMIEGPAGSGKNAMIRSIAHRLNRPTVTVSIAEGTGTETLVGMPVPVSGPNGIAVEFRDGVLINMLRAGGLLTLDEVNMGDERVLARLHDGLANMMLFTVPEDPNNPTRVESPYTTDDAGNRVSNGFTMICTGNPHDSGKYTGTKELNMAFRDRFLHLPMDYLGIKNPEAEARALVSHTGIRETKARRIVDVMNTIRKRSRMTDAELRESKSAPLYVDASTRSAIDVAMLAVGELPIMPAFEVAFLNKINANDRLVAHKLILDQFAADGVPQD